jgi:lysophospholipid acyltransferase (LPLAT)-like uncharacterized protein
MGWTKADWQRRLMKCAMVIWRMLTATWRYSKTIPPDCEAIVYGQQPAVIVFWHGKMMPAFPFFGQRGHGALTSLSRDGSVLAEHLERVLGYMSIRGSSSRGGAEAFSELVKSLGRKSCIVTPDGPRGPRQRAKGGALFAAVRTGVPILLVSWDCRRRWTINSWDHMEIPYPFSDIHIRTRLYDPQFLDEDVHVRPSNGQHSQRRVEADAIIDFERALNQFTHDAN